MVDLQFHAAPFVTAKPLAAYWGFSYTTVLAWTQEGRLPAVKVRRQYRIRTHDARKLETVGQSLFGGNVFEPWTAAGKKSPR
jgi:excisionase family DNA binding protein